MVVFFVEFEVAKDECDDEEVVDGEHFFGDVGGEELRGVFAVHVDKDEDSESDRDSYPEQ